MMGRRWWQNQIAESRLTLPLSVAVFLIVCVLEGVPNSTDAMLGAWVCFMTAIVILITNVELKILRVRSRLNESLWLLLAATMPWLYSMDVPVACAFGLSGALGLLVSCYQTRVPVERVFHSFLCLGAAGILSPVMLLLSPVFYLCLALFLRAFSWKTFWAGMVGLVAPFCFMMLYGAFDDDVYFACEVTMKRWQAAIPRDGLSLLPDEQLVPVWGMLVLVSLVGIVHYMRKRYNDKIRVRMMYYVYLYVTLFLHAAFLLLPSSRFEVLAMLAVSSSPLLAHYWAIEGGRVGQVTLLVCLAVWAGVLAVSYLAV